MKINPIEIVDIEENWTYGRTAFLVDRKDFLADIDSVRKKIGLKKIIPFNLMYPWYQTNIKQVRNSGFLKGELVDCLMKLSDRIYFDLIPKYGLSRGYFRLLWHAVLCGKVAQEDLELAPYKMTILESGRFKFSLGENEEVIVINPDSTLKQVTKIFQKYKKELKKLDTFTNIKRDRAWYWKKQNGLSYKQIWASITLSERNITPRGVLVAIKRYKENLETPL